jgi:hypothetical protein
MVFVDRKILAVVSGGGHISSHWSDDIAPRDVRLARRLTFRRPVSSNR